MENKPGLQEAKEFIEKIVAINRVTKVTKGGKKMSFSALVAVGDANGKVGMALGKANEVADAIRKGLAMARRDMFNVAMKGSTITHTIIGRYGAAKVLLKPASHGTGVIASGPVRSLCDCVGIKDILTKCLKSDNPINVMRATIDGFKHLKFKAANIVEDSKEETKEENKNADSPDTAS
ncbi:MAG TPA: 30S ribosomal protein S5 [Candidatus Omnitrophota bacterium]|nr:30S ribosomal protein S5 [Candidatus Omnitrophota bacterium]